MARPAALRAFLRSNFAVPSESNGCSCAHFPPLAGRVPIRVISQSPFSKKTIAPSLSRKISSSAIHFQSDGFVVIRIRLQIGSKIGSVSGREQGPCYRDEVQRGANARTGTRGRRAFGHAIRHVF